MLKKKITYVDYNDNERTEEFYFNLTKAELMEMELGTVGGLEQMIKNIVAAQDTPSIIATFKDIILKSYVRSLLMEKDSLRHQRLLKHLPRQRHTLIYLWSLQQMIRQLLISLMVLCHQMYHQRITLT